MARRIVLCADDYGLAPGVGAAIRELIERGRLTATSCMTLCPHWPEEAQLLRALMTRADIGLHLTLTDQAPLGPMPVLAPNGRLPPLKHLMRLAFTGGLDLREVRAELTRQIDAFVTHFGAPPDFIDGHQHVHQLPVVRDAVVEALMHRPGPYVRLCREPRTDIVRRGIAVPKALLISELGRGLAGAVQAAGIPANSSFRGVYDFSATVPFPELMGRFIERPEGRTLVMVHPGIPDEHLRRADPLVDQRAVEHAFLRGPGFAELLAARGVRLARFAAIQPAGTAAV